MDQKLRLQWNRAFKIFVEKVEQSSYFPIEFDIPEMNLGFYGVPRNINLKIYPTKKCLIGLDDASVPFILILNEFQICHFERVSFSLRNFDMIFVHKNLMNKPIRISSISRDNLDNLQDFINLQNIPFSTTVQNLDWKKIMENIRSDLQIFIQNGCWNFLCEEELEKHDQDELENYQPEENEWENEDKDFDENEDDFDLRGNQHNYEINESHSKSLDSDELEVKAL